MEKINFTNGTTPALNATNLNKLQDNAEDAINGLENNLFNLIYPVGSLYMSINSTNPSTFFGGTWEQIKDRFLLSAGDTYNLGETGGEATHTLTVDELPSHVHEEFYGNLRWVDQSGSGSVYSGNATSYSESPTARANLTGSTGNGQAHNNMPPYIVVYVWKRTD